MALKKEEAENIASQIKKKIKGIDTVKVDTDSTNKVVNQVTCITKRIVFTSNQLHDLADIIIGKKVRVYRSAADVRFVVH